MGTVIIQEYTTKNPISMIGKEAGVCWGADITDKEKNFKRGLNCIKSEHGRTWEYPDIYSVIDGYSARVTREWYTHISGDPTRLQASSRYIDYEHGFDYVTPYTIEKNTEAKSLYHGLMINIQKTLARLEEIGIPREDSAMGLPLGMTTKIVDKRNLRNVVDMSHQRLCTRAYWEYRELMNDYLNALKAYSGEWEILVNMLCEPKCQYRGYCTEQKSCGRMPKA